MLTSRSRTARAKPRSTRARFSALPNNRRHAWGDLRMRTILLAMMLGACTEYHAARVEGGVGVETRAVDGGSSLADGGCPGPATCYMVVPATSTLDWTCCTLSVPSQPATCVGGSWQCPADYATDCVFDGVCTPGMGPDWTSCAA